MTKNMIAMDYGASGGRAMLGSFDGSKITLKRLHRFSNDPVRLGDTLYWDFPRLFHELKQGLGVAKKEGLNKIDGIGVDTWGVDFGLLDKKGGLLSNPVHYRDQRTYEPFEKAKKDFGSKYIYEKTGIQLAVFNTLYQLYSLKLDDDAAYGCASDMLFLPDLFNYFLTGEKKTEYSILSTSQLYDPRKKDFAWDLIDRFGLRKDIFNEIIKPGTKLGMLKQEISEQIGINRADVFAITGHDTACAVVSVPSLDIDSTIYLSSGTWSLMGVERKSPFINNKSYEYNITNEGGYDDTFRSLANIVGLWIYQECRREWIREEGEVSFDELEEEAALCKRFESFIDTGDQVFFEPGNMPKKIQEFCARTNQPVPQKKGEIVTTIMQSLAMKYKQTAEQLDDLTGKEHKTINIIGGGCRNTLLSQFTADATGKLVYAGPDEATSAGNILVQLMAQGEIDGLSQAREVSRRSFDIQRYEPKETKLWDAAYEKYIKIAK